MKALLKAKTRLHFMLWIYDWSQHFYTKYFKQKKVAWSVSVDQLKFYPVNSLGRELANFIEEHGFNLMPKLENHDVCHLLTQTGTDIQEEIAMQYLLCGNGKKSLYMVGMITIGTIIYPEYISYYLRKFNAGKQFRPLHQVDFEQFLTEDISILRKRYKK